MGGYFSLVSLFFESWHVSAFVLTTGRGAFLGCVRDLGTGPAAMPHWAQGSAAP